jgi:phenylacetate-coenzyme A ligase PaaK-like adenylate-forming protein
MWRARNWFGIEPHDKLFLFWGHRHLLGTGWQGFKNARKRQLKDLTLGYLRFPAYDLSDPALHRAAEALEQSRADYVVGYSVALDRFARVNQGRELKLKRPLKAVIGTAESFPFSDSEQVIARVLRAPVAMEYGAVETNLIAHTAPEGRYRVFWRNYFLEALEQGPSSGLVLRITSLYPRAFPLLRYQIGDEIVAQRPAFGLTNFERVLGRCNDYLEFPDGFKVHSEAVTHSLSGVKELSGYQMVQAAGRLVLRVTLRAPLSEPERAGIRERLIKLHPAFEPVEIEEVGALERTIAGKTPMVLRKEK